MTERLGPNGVTGEVRAYRVSPDSAVDRSNPFVRNLVLKEWGALLVNLLTRKSLNYAVTGMYLEFENVASPGDPVTVPDYDRETSSGVAYYNGLSSSLNRDYLRVPLIATSTGTSDAAEYPNGNRATFFAQTTGLTGVHGKSFSEAANSVIFGGALVALVDENDPTKDLVLSRFYLPVPNQQPKLATSQIGFEWRLTFE